MKFVRGDIFLTQAQAVGIGLSANGHLGVMPLYTALQDRYPVFVSEHRQRGRSGLQPPGTTWTWREGQPWLSALIVQETPQGAIRLRHVEAAILSLYKSWEYEGLRSLALMRLGDESDWPAAREIVTHYLAALPVIVYEEYIPGFRAEKESL